MRADASFSAILRVISLLAETGKMTLRNREAWARKQGRELV
jgi:hypothetical protein